LVVSPRDLPKATALVKRAKERYFEIGSIARGNGRVVFR